jgi:hypothetical protein
MQLPSKVSAQTTQKTPSILVAYCYSRVSTGPIPSTGRPLLSRTVVRITQQRLFTKNLSPRDRVYRAVAQQWVDRS